MDDDRVNMGSKKSGRRLRLTPEVQEIIVKYIRSGAHKVIAAKAAGIDDDTLRNWLDRGAAGEKRFVKFYRAVSTAESEDELRLLAIVRTAAIKHHPGKWTAAAWMLEKRYGRTWGRGAQAAVGVTIQRGDDDPEAPPKTRFEFYIPINGRRPGDDDEDEA